MKVYGGVDVLVHIFLTSAVTGSEWLASRPCRFTRRKRDPGTHSIGGWMDPRAGLDDVENRKFLTLPGLALRPHGRPARSQSLYRLSYPGTITNRGAERILMPECLSHKNNIIILGIVHFMR
jgi:hypothetical protein